ncbi:F0F1 ATP synthase subunit B [Gottschalkia acidurici]|nr:F0F1 ATP synthase subunit B [Gottschalkia acidurici]
MEVKLMPDIPNLVLQISSTLVLFLVLRHFLYAPIVRMLAARSEKVYEEMAEAKKQNEEATSLRIEYESRIQEAKDEARNIVEGAKKRGDQLKDEIVLEAKNESSNILAKARTDMEREKEKVLNDLKSEVVEIAMLAATKVVEKDLDENTHKNMINKFITEVGESKWKN